MHDLPAHARFEVRYPSRQALIDGLRASTIGKGAASWRLTMLCWLIGAGLSLVLCACQSVTVMEVSFSPNGWLRPRYSASTYLLMDAYPFAPVPDTEAAQQAADSATSALSFSLFAVMPEGTCTLVQRNQILTSPFRLRNEVLTTSSGTYYNVLPTSYGFTMIVPVPVPTQEPADTLALRCGLYRIEFGHDKQRVLALADAVFTHPTGPETDEQLRRRVKHCLAFYALYFKALYTNQFNRFRPNAVGMPVRFYRGALKLANYDPDAPWAGLYANANDAKRAHRLFRKAIKSVRVFPERGSLLLEYSLIFGEMSDFL